MIYVIPENASPAADSGVDLINAWMILWRNKGLIATVTGLFAVLSIAYALTLTHWYRAEMLLAPAEERETPGVVGQLGGLASLAGISVGGKGNAEPLAVLQSRDFTREFIEEQNLLPVLFEEQWDAEKGVWKDKNPEEWPDIREAIEFFSENVLTVEEDRSTSMVTLWVEWTDPELAAQWATLLVKKLNERMRARALKEAETNVTYLRDEISSTSMVALQQSIGRLLESELQKLMLARGDDEFAFRVIDRADVPLIPSRPSRTLIVVLLTLFGGVLSAFIVFVRELVINRHADSTPKSLEGGE